MPRKTPKQRIFLVASTAGGPPPSSLRPFAALRLSLAEAKLQQAPGVGVDRGAGVHSDRRTGEPLRVPSGWILPERARIQPTGSKVT